MTTEPTPTGASRRASNDAISVSRQQEAVAVAAAEDDSEIRFPWSRSDRALPRKVVQPLQRFLNTEAAGGILLFVAAIVALVWANSPWRGAYESLWHQRLTIGLAGWAVSLDLREWVNEALMTLFFFVVGLEIKRELVPGEFRDRCAAALPVYAAVGGMVVPAAFYLAVTRGGAAGRGWAIPVATDIAFALGVIALLRGLPACVKVFLLALAIADDIGAILVIAVFYSGSVHVEALLAAAALLAVVVLLRQLQIRWMPIYVMVGVAAWFATLESGIHATLAGVALGLLTPSIPFQRPRAVSEEAHRIADETVDDPQPPDADAQYWMRLAALSRETVSPLARLLTILHPWTSYLIVPVFALANAGVALTGPALATAATSTVTLGVMVGLVVGKPLGIGLASWLALRSRMATMPEEMRWRQLVGLGALAGIGFTISVFVTTLAFGETVLADQAKVGILVASVLAGLIGSTILIHDRRAAAREDAVAATEA